ncbi:hypothetical protein [Thiofilum flexile]|uniref:hypothetical protein n=1 Tax=Thiofilum flexile TaxID=125627 RepID=UPI000381EAD4|nr:hypothetical protein [Thiofilum flexile]
MAGMTAHVPTRPDNRANTGNNSAPQTRRVAKPATTAVPDDNFINKTAKNYADAYNGYVKKNADPNKAQDTPHKEIMLWLLDHAYNPDNMPDTDPNKGAYLAIKSIVNAQGVVVPRIGSPRYLVRDAATVPTPNNAFFIGDLMQVQADGVTIRDWAGANAVNDTALTSQFAQDFNNIVNRVNRTNTVIQLSKFVNRFDGVAHRDGMQIIPNQSKGDRFAGAISNGVTIDNVTINSAGALQGIFATDGAFTNLHITNNTVQIGGEHALSINGMLSGKIEGNTTNRSIKLLPLRIGGGRNIYITGFQANSGYSYAPLSQIAPNQGNIVDARTIPVAGKNNYYDVNLTRLQNLAKKPGYIGNYQKIMDQLVAEKAAKVHNR